MKSRERKVAWRVGMLAAIVFGVFWSVWYLIAGSVPATASVRGFGTEVFFPWGIACSRFFDAPAAAVLVWATILLTVDPSPEKEDLSRWGVAGITGCLVAAALAWVYDPLVGTIPFGIIVALMAFGELFLNRSLFSFQDDDRGIDACAFGFLGWTLGNGIVIGILPGVVLAVLMLCEMYLIATVLFALKEVSQSVRDRLKQLTDWILGRY